MKIKKRHIVLSALILALAAAVYLNWQFSDSGSSLLTPASKELGAATYVNANTKATVDEAVKTSKESDQTDQYFAKCLTERKQAQDEAVTKAKEVITLTDSDEDLKKEAVEQMSKLEDIILAQSNIESVLKAKGFSQCICFISDDNCTVTVKKSELETDSPLIIKDAVISQTDIDFNNIKINEI